MRFSVSIILFFLVAFSLDVAAQSKKGKKKPATGAPASGYSQLPNSLNPNGASESNAPRRASKNKKSGKVTYDAQRQYYERVAQVAKDREKTAKIMEKPQYSDPMYFGHKRKPKKRPANKMRFCKECGIRH